MLLSVSKNPPHKIGEKYLLRDIICIFYDLRTNLSQIYVNGEISGRKTIAEFRQALDGIAHEIDTKNRAGHTRKAIVFVNDLDVLRCILPDGQASSGKKKTKQATYTLEIETDHFVFRNFNIIFNSKAQKVRELYADRPACAGMAAFIESLGLPIKDCRYSLAYVSKRLFYADIKAELWEDTKKERRIYQDMQTYEDMQAGNQGGALSSFSKNDILFTILHNVLSFDKKSAYPAAFVKDSFFPIGRIKRITESSKKIQELWRCIRTGKWFKIVIESPCSIPAIDLYRTPLQEDPYIYGIEFWDYQTLKEIGCDIFEHLNGRKWRLYITEKTGYMPRCFRQKIIELYNVKNSLERSDTRRFLVKTQLDMIYGKGLQKYQFKTDSDVFKKYLLRGENFLTPAMSMHVVSAVRHEIIKISAHFGKDCIAVDTDGVKLTCDMFSAIDYFNAINDYIKDQNRAAGFDSDIGIWDFEYSASRFIQFAPKVYAFETQTGLHTKFAGINERNCKKYLKSIDGDPFEVWAREGLQAETCAGWIYIPDVGFLEKKVPYIIRKDDDKV